MTLREFFALSKRFNYVSGDHYKEGIKICELTIGDFTEVIDFYSYPVVSGGYMDTFDNYEQMGLITCSKGFSYSFLSEIGVFSYSNYTWRIVLSCTYPNEIDISICGASILNDDICFDYDQLDLLGFLDNVFVEVFHDVFNYSVQYTFGASARYKWKPEYPCYYSSEMGSVHFDLDSPIGSISDFWFKRSDRLGFNVYTCCNLDFTKLGVLLGTKS